MSWWGKRILGIVPNDENLFFALPQTGATWLPQLLFLSNQASQLGSNFRKRNCSLFSIQGTGEKLAVWCSKDTKHVLKRARCTFWTEPSRTRPLKGRFVSIQISPFLILVSNFIFVRDSWSIICTNKECDLLIKDKHFAELRRAMTLITSGKWNPR